MPLDGDAESECVGLDLGAAVAGVEHDRLDVGGEAEHAVDVGFDVVVEEVVPGLPGISPSAKAVAVPKCSGSKTLSGKQKLVRSRVCAPRRTWADPKRGAAPYGRRSRSRPPYLGRSAGSASS